MLHFLPWPASLILLCSSAIALLAACNAGNSGKTKLKGNQKLRKPVTTSEGSEMTASEKGKKGTGEGANEGEDAKPKEDQPAPNFAPAQPKPLAPGSRGIADSFDPNYQTLAAVAGGQGVFGEDKAAPRAPVHPAAVAGTNDPNYQTLAAVAGGQGVFGEDKAGGGGGGGGGGGAVHRGMAETHDPNYQTLAAVGGDAFGADKKSH